MTRNEVSKVLAQEFQVSQRPSLTLFQSQPKTVVLTLMLNALLKPEAKKPPKGAMREAKTDRMRECSTAGYVCKVTPNNCKGQRSVARGQRSRQTMQRGLGQTRADGIYMAVGTHRVICLDKEVTSPTILSVLQKQTMRDMHVPWMCVHVRACTMCMHVHAYMCAHVQDCG